MIIQNESYTIFKSMQTKKRLQNFLITNKHNPLFHEFQGKFLSLKDNFDFTIDFTNEPQQFTFHATVSYITTTFNLFVNIDKLYSIFDEYPILQPINIPLELLDLKLALQSTYEPRYLDKPILVIGDKTLCSMLTSEEFKGKYFPIDGRNRIRKFLEINANTIKAYRLDRSILLDCMMSDYDRLAFELLIKFFETTSNYF